MTEQSVTPYFPRTIQIDARTWSSLDLGALSRLVADRRLPDIIFFRQLALRLNRKHPAGAPAVRAGQINMYATLLRACRHLIDVVAAGQAPDPLADALGRAGVSLSDPAALETVRAFTALFPPDGMTPEEGLAWLDAPGENQTRLRLVLRELLLLNLAAENRALAGFRELLDDRYLISTAPAYPGLMGALNGALSSAPLLPELSMTLAEALRAPLLASPDSLSGQIGYIQERWQQFLPPELIDDLLTAADILLEEERSFGGGPGEPGMPPVMEFGRQRTAAGRTGAGGPGYGPEDGSSVFGGYEYPEYEHFSSDADWMSHVVLMAKMVYVWLHQLSQNYARPITRLDQVPDEELDRLAEWGFTGLWLIGVWERSPASQRIKQLCGNPEAIASAYSLYDYEIAADLGGWEALHNLKHRAGLRGIRLASDMVPNHTGIYSRWLLQHPDWFVQTDYPPFPSYQFNGEDLSRSPDMVIQLEDGYWSRHDAAVVFRMIERSTGRVRYIYHGNDGTSLPWNDTAQLNYLQQEVREAVIQTILHVARNFPIIRFDAAMTLAKKHYQRLWFPVRGLGGGIPSRAEHGMSREEFDQVFPTEFWREVVDRVASEVPGTLLLAEAFWLMEGYFVRTLGMHRVYNSAFMNMLKQEENAKYRQTIKNVLEFNPEVLKRFVNFMNNPDEKTAVEQFGREGKYFGACVLLATMPGLPMFGHGQVEGFHEKYGMEYRQSYWDEVPDEHLIRLHRQHIFPLLRCRDLFSGSEHFALFDFQAGDSVNEDVFAYSNRCGDRGGLVLYHNRYAETAGWIRESAAYAVQDGGEEPVLRRTTLAAALNLADDPQVYYSFRDHTRGETFLRSSRELHEKGLYAELSGYEYHVFTGFTEIRDDAGGSWGELCRSLDGRGVASLEDERTQMVYAPLNRMFRFALQAGIEILADDGMSEIKLSAAVQEFRSGLSGEGVTEHTPLSPQEAADQIEACLARVSQLRQIKPAAQDARELHTCILQALATDTGQGVLCAWMLLNRYDAEADRFGFGYSLLKTLALSGTQGTRTLQLLSALLSLTPRPGSEFPPDLEVLFSSGPVREFLRVHISGGTEWFHRESFEELLMWTGLISLITRDSSRRAGETLRAVFGRMAREVRRLTELAGHAGYRTRLLCQLSSIPAAPAAVRTGTAQRPGKPHDAQDTARTKKAKTPDHPVSR